MFLGQHAAEVISSWLQQKQISVASINLKSNCIGDAGFKALLPGLMQTELISLNLSQNNLSNKSSRTIQSLLITNETIISLSLKSYQGNDTNRFGKEFARAIAKCL
jgi:hypothetical protein